MHGLVPPHPGPLTAIDYLDADLGLTLALGVARRRPHRRSSPARSSRSSPAAGSTSRRRTASTARSAAEASIGSASTPEAPGAGSFGPGDNAATPARPSFGITMFSVLLPVVLMMGKALVDIFIDDETNPLRDGPRPPRHPAGRAAHRGPRRDVHPRPRLRAWTAPQVARSVESSLPADRRHPADRRRRRWLQAGRSSTPASAPWSPTGPADSNVSVLLLAWVLAVLIRLATGSATVAT